MKCDTSRQEKLHWDKGDLNSYRSSLSHYLANICLRVEALVCNGRCNGSHTQQLENYSNSISCCMHTAASSNIPVVKTGVQKHWWTPELDDLKQQCIEATDLWKLAGRPRSGDVNSNRVRIKLKYKNAIKEAAANADMQ